ncbi:DNA repair protein RecN [Spiribacter sp. 218]|uniref:DNA repair protein RecN n=1 Tax=Spiribacter pallidus TaxID=1987936 RepID=UPI00349FA62D
MLNQIQVRDFAIIDRLEIDLETGLTALTGETGAGKSILLDALGLCLGDRADTAMVANDAERSEVHVRFDVSDTPAARHWLGEEGLDEDDECLLRRVIHRNGRSQAWINGRPATRAQLEALGEYLVGVHGQHAHQALMRADNQRRSLDGFAGNLAERDRLASAYAGLRAVDDEIERLSGGHEDHQDRMDLLRYQLEELEAEALEADALHALEQEHRRLAGAEDILNACHTSLAMLYEGETTAQSIIAQAERSLEPHTDADQALAEACDLLANGQVQIEEACQSLRHFADRLEMDPQRLEEIDQKISRLNDLARKHHTEPEALTGLAAALRDELEALENADTRLADLQQQRQALVADYHQAAAALSATRQTAAAALEERVNALLAELGMGGAALLIRLEYNADGEPGPNGLDRVGFDVRTNPDQPAAPLSKVASGGELSRIGLALEVATADTAELPTLIFDEADTGIGGAVAEVVGRKLRELAGHHQVLCITHLPQVAAQAHHQLQIEKQQNPDGRTVTDVQPLDTEARTRELARMLGGVEITDNTLSHAREMLERAG